MKQSPNEPPKAPLQCPACGAAVDGGATACWLCQEPLVIDAELVDSPEPLSDVNPWVLHGSIWLAIVLSAVLIFALSIGEKKYYAIGFAIVAVPALLISLGGATLSRILNQPWHPAVKLSVGMAVALVLLPVAVVVAFFIACIDLCSGNV
jgi:hypothetical protein